MHQNCENRERAGAPELSYELAAVDSKCTRARNHRVRWLKFFLVNACQTYIHEMQQEK